ncbi:MAG: Hsp20/alpha crystallin family protein [Melioribacteraceae bacterium]|nr:Hsp20/alpha crystallin family protein [Melioribacteraceae bacterium]MCF8352971.1 Hsp20/alpha crystallin family protein [Melioribacteraceae bacterium]MCF8395354.1 Hsp20/alpha crystallin family protein [Melioribacteraceae bacterium]MCF8417844.1 Hsp20/alpha crystallin family protein [Melioribacteraceae bacterium]
MTLVRFEPMRELQNFDDYVQNFFNSFSQLGIKREGFSPRIDISTDEKNLIVEAELPGVKKENIKLQLEDNILTISGEKKSENKIEEGKYYRNERNFGSFKRCFTLPEEVESDKVDAKFENGILRIVMNKVEEKTSKERIIELK